VVRDAALSRERQSLRKATVRAVVAFENSRGFHEGVKFLSKTTSCLRGPFCQYADGSSDAEQCAHRERRGRLVGGDKTSTLGALTSASRN
jgi:hypothetical protein